MGYATVDVRFFLIDLEPDGCLVAEQLRIRTKNLRNNGRRPQKGGWFRTGADPAKKSEFFCDGVVFSLDRSLLMGASSHSFASKLIYSRFHHLISILDFNLKYNISRLNLQV
jgi:hypothetical protein